MVVAAPLNDDGTRNEPEYEPLPSEEELREEARREDAAFNEQTYGVSARVKISRMPSFAPPGATTPTATATATATPTPTPTLHRIVVELRVIGSHQAARNAAAAAEAAAAGAAARAALLPEAAREVAAPFVAAALNAAVDAIVAAGIEDGSIMSSH